MRAIVTQAIITGFTTSVDKSLRFRGVTPELTDKDAIALMSIRGIALRILLEPLEVTLDEKYEVKNPLNQKPPSARLRGVLFVLWDQLTKAEKLKDKTFDLFYLEQMSRVIDDFKSQLEPEA